MKNETKSIEIKILSDDISDKITIEKIKNIEKGYSTKKYYKLNNIIKENKITFELELKEFEEEKFTNFNYIQDSDLIHYKKYFNEGYSLGCFIDDDLIGFLFSKVEEWNNSLKIMEIHIKPEQKGNGIGTKMLNFLEKIVIEKKFIRSILIETQVNNYPAISFYKKNGYNIIGIYLILIFYNLLL
jgi:ribosomal protein S18 acetylase RimI-like enzyme